MIGLLRNNRGASGIVLMVAALLVLALAPPGCTEEPGEPCVGGLLAEDGVTCLPKCDPAKCLEGNVCVGNECKLLCSAHDQCFFGIQECQEATEDDTGAIVQVCQSNGRQPVLTDGFPVGTYGFGCPFGEDACIAMACPNGLECDPNACGDCQLDTVACGDKEQCNIGRCTETGLPCTFNTCPINECKKMNCITAGEGDANAYCTARDCSADSDCPGGFYCGVTRDPRTVCGDRTCENGTCSHDGSACSGDANCAKGANLCGATTEPCLDESQFATDGASYFEGALCVLRRTCLRTEECSPCSNNLDCNGGKADVCANNNGESVCARFCSVDTDCADDKACVAYGSTCENDSARDCASPADCVDMAACLPRNVCLPRSGSCKAMPGPNNFCQHCVDDTDCGGPGTSVVCADVNDGEKACFDTSFSVTCMTDEDCPMSPGGAHGECLDEGENVNPGDSVYQRCYFPRDILENKWTCYP